MLANMLLEAMGNSGDPPLFQLESGLGILRHEDSRALLNIFSGASLASVLAKFSVATVTFWILLRG